MSAVFISYVHEDTKAVIHLANVLEKNGVEVWLDRNNLKPGMRWQQAIKSAISEGAFFLSIYSRSRQLREQGYVNEELVLAIDQIRRRPSHKAWFIPVKLDDCEIEDRDIGAGESILSLQVCDLTQGKHAFASLLRVLGVDEPITDLGEPLASGVPSFVKIVGGGITYSGLSGIPESFGDIHFSISGGWCARQNDSSILAYIETKAPFGKWQSINETLGLSAFFAASVDRNISHDDSSPTTFSFEQIKTLPSGVELPDFMSGGAATLPFDVDIRSVFSATGVIDGFSFSGSFVASVKMSTPYGEKDLPMQGKFELRFAEE